jgi:hypothetical protein
MEQTRHNIDILVGRPLEDTDLDVRIILNY